ncbi:MAG: PspC domain-containing protein [Actinomycetota bacterium]|nr:PspC domain-containing protein [Actinomycetota bacterium]
MASRPQVRLLRSRENRLVAGVCAGVARTFGVDPLVVRVAVIALTLAGGVGVFLYVAAWALLPEAADEGAGLRPDGQGSRPEPSKYELSEALAVGAIVLGVVLLVRASGAAWFSDAVVWPVVLAGFGLAVLWRQADDEARPSLTGLVGSLDVRSRRVALARVAVGVVLVVGGVSAFLAASNAFSAVRQAFLATAGIVGGLAIISGPWWLRLGRDLARERRERIRSEERAEMAAHLHDSVLQTLALIQRSAEDPRAVVAMARRQERELRGWLYGNREKAADGAETLAGELGRVGEEVEELHGVPVEVVTVGDAPVDEAGRVILAAAREAMVNAAKWSGAPTISVYAEVRDGEATVFVRDWGKGFDLETVGPDHHGIRESIVARMQRHGGTAHVRTSPGEGTEVQLRMGG